MKPAKVWCVAIGLLAGTIVLPAALAQDSPGANQEAVQDSSTRQDHTQAQPKAQMRDRQTPGRLWNPQGMHGELLQWNQHIPTNNPQALWHYVGRPNGGGLFAGSGTSQDLVLAAPDAALRNHLNLPDGQGVVVVSVDPSSTAAQAGIQQSDILLSLGDHALAKPEDLYDRLKEVGEKPVSLTLLRAGSRKTIQVEPQIRIFLKPVAAKTAPHDYYIGIAVTPVEPVLRAQLGLTQPHAVIVNQLVQDSPAAHAGIALHDIILSIDGKRILDVSDIAKTVQAKGGKPITLEVIGKGGKPRTVSVTPGRRKITETSQAGPEHQFKTSTYDVVYPAAVLEGYNRVLSPVERPYRQFDATTLQDRSYDLWVENPGANQKSQTTGPDLAKRLDTLDSDLKELRTLVEELRKAATSIIERQKSDSATTPRE